MPTHREQVLKKIGLPRDTSLSIEKLAEILDLPIESLVPSKKGAPVKKRTPSQPTTLSDPMSQNPVA